MTNRWETLFKITVFLLTIPAVLLLAFAILTVLLTVVGGHLGIVVFAFGLTRWQLTIGIAMVFGAIIFFFALAFAFLRPHKRQKSGVNR